MTERPAADGPPAAAQGARCAGCGAGLAAGQEWCVECGAARTVLHPAPDWRVPVVVIGVVVVAVLIAAVIALVSLPR